MRHCLRPHPLRSPAALAAGWAPVVLALLASCSGGNRAPIIVSFNGEPVQQELFSDPYLETIFSFAPGDQIPITLEVRDPENQAIQLWFPKAPPGLSFEADAQQGTWNVPEDFTAAWWTFVIIAEDSGDPSAATTLYADWLSEDGEQDTASTLP